jgi:hypothetical protein
VGERFSANRRWRHSWAVSRAFPSSAVGQSICQSHLFPAVDVLYLSSRYHWSSIPPLRSNKAALDMDEGNGPRLLTESGASARKVEVAPHSQRIYSIRPSYPPKYVVFTRTYRRVGRKGAQQGTRMRPGLGERQPRQAHHADDLHGHSCAGRQRGPASPAEDDTALGRR